MHSKTLLAIVLALGSGAAFAAIPAFEELDTNADGLLSFEEASVVEELDFDAADANEDGELDVAEYEAAMAE